jgi:hypothetical protein
MIKTMPFKVNNRLFIFFFLSAFLMAAGEQLRADVYLLKAGGRIEGELLNPDDVPRKLYKIRTGDGLEIDIEAKYIERSRKGEREALREYNSFAPFEEDTIDNHLKLADWCSKHQLPELSKLHWKQILQHDPDHKDARNVLGYIRSDGTWMKRQELLESRGLINVGGSWKTQQQIDTEKFLEKRKRTEADWTKKIDAYRNVLPNNAKARNEILTMTDPLATTALWNALQKERNEDTRILLIKALSNIATSVALHNIARLSMNAQEVLEVRKVCFEELSKHPEAKQAIVGFYAAFLNPQMCDAATINAAAHALGEIGGRSALPQLIDVLITVHSDIKTVDAPSPTFGDQPGGGQGMGLGWGTRKVKEVKESRNQEVLTALIKLTGVNFQYEKNAWRVWLIESRKTSSFNARRG